MAESSGFNWTIKKASELKKCLKLSTGSSKLDELLSGGLPAKGIIEISGESGSGKSQLCMQLALTVQFSEENGGLGGGAIYICSEEAFQSKRLYQIIQRFNGKTENKIEFSNNVYIMHVRDSYALNQSFAQIAELTQRTNIKLLILDSITALFRGNFMDRGTRRKAADLRTIARNFYKLQGRFGVIIVCVNQVSAGFFSEKGPVPALGLAWANLVTHRIQLRRRPRARILEVVFSPDLPHMEIPFEINEKGIDAL